MRKLVLIALMLVVAASVATAATNYIKIKHTGQKYVITPATEQDYQNAVATQEPDVAFYSSQKDVSDFARAGTFGAYNTLAEAKGALQVVDQSMIIVWSDASGHFD